MSRFPGWKIALVLLVCLFGVAFAAPNALPPDWLPNAKRMNLGLDLRGGSYLLMEVDFDTYLKEQAQTLTDDVRFRLKEKKLGYTSLGGGVNGVSFYLRDADADFDAMKSAVREISPGLDISREDDGRIVVTYSESALKEMRQNVLGQSIEIVRRRVDETGTREPIIQRQGENRILLQVPGLKDPEQLKRLLGKTAKMTFHLMDDQDPYPTHMRPASVGTRLLQGWNRGIGGKPTDPNEPRYYMIKKKIILSGDLLVNAHVSYDQGAPVVSFRFNNQGSRKFADVTTENVGRPFAIVLDDEVITAPVIREPIVGGSGMISGGFTTQSANDLALLLRAGALPAPIKILEERTVGPSLGADSIQDGIRASIVGAVFVVTFMVLSYGLFGIFSSIALAVNLALLVAAMSLLQATLTLPGIAGIVLTMGMSVDANVLIYERMREEVRVGKTPIAAVEQGFLQASATIFDSNVTALIATLLLYIFGSGAVKGFAVTLAVGIIASIFTAVMLTRLMVVVWLRRVRPKTLPI